MRKTVVISTGGTAATAFTPPQNCVMTGFQGTAFVLSNDPSLTYATVPVTGVLDSNVLIFTTGTSNSPNFRLPMNAGDTYYWAPTAAGKITMFFE